jgi:hypothetical protein
VADLVEQGGLAGVDVAEDAADGTAELSGLACEVGVVVLQQLRFLLFLFFLLVLDHLLDLLLRGLFALLFFLLRLLPVLLQLLPLSF